MSIYERPTKSLMADWAREHLSPGQIFNKAAPMQWFAEHYSKIKRNTVGVHVEGRLTAGSESTTRPSNPAAATTSSTSWAPINFDCGSRKAIPHRSTRKISRSRRQPVLRTSRRESRKMSRPARPDGNLPSSETCETTLLRT
jgi:hypothetical protein